MIDPEAVRWMRDRRGISEETLSAFGVHNDGDALVFPYPGAKKYRKGLEKEGRKFWWDPPTKAGQVPFLPPEFEQGSHMILLEGETDTMAAWQAAPPEAKKSIVGLSGTNSFKDHYAEELFGRAKFVFAVFDRDDPYENPDGAKSTETGWKKVKDALGRKAKRVVLPQGINDVAEFFMRYDWEAFRVLLKAAMQPVTYYPRLDLSKPALPTDWLVEDLLVSNEVTVLAADSGVGKSWITMQLALAVAGDEETFLGQPLKKHGKVIYVDEENSAELIMQRLNALGMKDQHWNNLDYLWYAGVDLFREPEKLHAEALDREPTLIVIDSLSRVALGAKENDNDEMSLLIRRGIVPLARDTGASVVVAHHTPTDNAGKPRGATAIKAAADEVISIMAAQRKDGTHTGTLSIYPSKPRRQLAHIQVRINGDMEKDGWVRVQEITEDTPF